MPWQQFIQTVVHVVKRIGQNRLFLMPLTRHLARKGPTENPDRCGTRMKQNIH